MRVYLLATLLYIYTAHGLSSDLDGYKLTLTPESGSDFTRHRRKYVTYYLSNELSSYTQTRGSSKFYLAIDYDRKNSKVSSIFTINEFGSSPNQVLIAREFNLTDFFLLQEMDNSPTAYNGTFSQKNKILLLVDGIGYAKFHLSLIEITSDNRSMVIVDHQPYEVKAVRRERMVDLGFDTAIIILAILNTFALGCVTDLSLVWRKLRDDLAKLAISSIVQFIAMPVITFGLTQLLDLKNEIGFGLLFASCVPGGGLGNLICAITSHADLDISITLNFLQLMVPLAAVPMWLYGLGQLYPNGNGDLQSNMYYLVLWLVALFIPYGVGIFVKRRKESVSDACLNWLIKPLLLLAFILFITLGLYINIYMFSVLSSEALAVGGALPIIGFGLNGLLLLVTRQGKSAAKAGAIEAANMNCIAVIVALRFTLPKPDGELASAVIMWLLFCTPIPFIIMFIYHRIKKKIMSHFEKKEFEKEQTATMLQSFATITHNAMQIGGLTEHNEGKKISEENGENGDTTLLLHRAGSTDQSVTVANHDADTSNESPLLRA